MKLKPEEHRKAAADLRKLAETSSKPDEKQFLLKTAKMFEYLAREAKRGGMKLKPEEHRKAAKNLSELTDRRLARRQSTFATAEAYRAYRVIHLGIVACV